MSELMNLKELRDHLKKIDDDHRDARKNVFADFLQNLGTSTGVKLVCVTGWTPGFNDGDPCEHTQVTVLTKDGAEQEGWEDDELPDNCSFDMNDSLSKSTVKDIVKLFDGAFADVIANTYDTNYRVFYVFEDGKVKTHQEDYDCGY